MSTALEQRVSSTEETGLSTNTDFSTELAPTAAAAEKQFEIQSAIIIAKRFPRDEDSAFQKLMKACARPTFAADAEYSFPRGGAEVSGPSVQLAREAARNWTNIRYGLTIIRDDDRSRQIQGWAWDVETNTKVTAEDDFQKLIERRGKGWIKPDERDLRELTNRRGAILVRNCILQLLPKDLIEDAVYTCRTTLKNDAAKDPDAARKRVLFSFSKVGVSAEMLAVYLGHPVGQSSPEEIANLQAIYKSISDSNSRWADYAGGSDSNGGDNGNGKSKSERLADTLKDKAATDGQTKDETPSTASAEPDKPKPTKAEENAEKKRLRGVITAYMKEQEWDEKEQLRFLGGEDLLTMSLDRLNQVAEECK